MSLGKCSKHGPYVADTSTDFSETWCPECRTEETKLMTPEEIGKILRREAGALRSLRKRTLKFSEIIDITVEDGLVDLSAKGGRKVDSGVKRTEG